MFIFFTSSLFAIIQRGYLLFYPIDFSTEICNARLNFYTVWGKSAKKKRLLNHRVEYHAASYKFAAVAFKNEIGKRLLSLVK